MSIRSRDRPETSHVDKYASRAKHPPPHHWESDAARSDEVFRRLRTKVS